MSVLVTGATGFIGSHVVRALVASGRNVHALVRKSASLEALEDCKDSIHIHVGDVTDSAEVEQCFNAAEPEIVFHLAADTTARHADGGLEGIDRSIEVNLRGTLNVVCAGARAKSRVRKFIRAGSIGEYGTASVPFDELDRERPISPYSASQVAATQFCQALQLQVQFDLVTVRPALVYGPGQGQGFFIPQLIRSCLEGTDFEMTEGSQKRDFVYVGDVVKGLLLAASCDGLGGEILNLATGEGHALANVASLVRELTGSSIQIKRGARPPSVSDPRDLISSTTHAAALLGWRAEVGLKEGLQRTIAWERSRHR
jgi:UDP-glucose 4-epimerase